MDMEKFIRRAMLERDIQQQELAEKIDYTKNGFNAFLKKNRVYVHDLERIAAALGYDVEITFRDRQSGKTISAD